MKQPTCKRCNGTGKEPDPTKTGIHMRTLRQDAGHSLREVATQMGFSAAYVSDLELGRRLWSAPLIEKATKAIQQLTKRKP